MGLLNGTLDPVLTLLVAFIAAVGIVYWTSKQSR